MERSSRRQFIDPWRPARRRGDGAPIAARAGGDAPPAKPLRKLLDIGPGGVISPGSAQDLRSPATPAYFADTDTRWIRMWADWPSLQPHPDRAPDDALSPGRAKLRALDEQIALANALGIRVLLMPYRFPPGPTGPRTRGPARGAGRRPSTVSPPTPTGRTAHGRASSRSCYGRYHAGRESGPHVDGFELVNEPNLQLWPQSGIAREVARLIKTAQAISARRAHSTMLYAPSISDDDAPTSERYTRWDEFVPALLDELAAIGYLIHSGQAWSHHNYTDVERRRTATNTQAIRALLAGRWAGYAEGRTPTVFVTEGGARLSRMPALYPAEDPRQAQAKCLRDAWARHQRDSGAGAGVAMFAQYLLYADPNFDCGLLDPYPSTVKRPAYAAWKAFPAYS